MYLYLAHFVFVIHYVALRLRVTTARCTRAQQIVNRKRANAPTETDQRPTPLFLISVVLVLVPYVVLVDCGVVVFIGYCKVSNGYKFVSDKV